MTTEGGQQIADSIVDHNDIDTTMRDPKELENEIKQKLSKDNFDEIARKINKADDLLVQTNRSAYQHRIEKLKEFKANIETGLDKIDKIYAIVGEDLESLRNFSETNGQRYLKQPLFESNYEQIRGMLIL